MSNGENYSKKLIEAALPLPEINDASAFDKRPGIGAHPKGIHHWWARLPLPTARAILYASVVDDPAGHPETWATDEAQDAERERLFDIMRRMTQKKLHEHPKIYAEARVEMLKHCNGKLPAMYDPFAGGGSIPLEANRLGFETHAGDLNPVAVLLNKCNLELIPPRVNKPPVNPEDRNRIGGSESWRGTHGLAADVRYYGRLIRDHAIKKIGHLYPKARLPAGGGQANVIAWIWARTVASPNPAALGRHVPLISTYWLSSKKGGEAWLQPVVDKAGGTYRFEVYSGTPNDQRAVSAGTKLGRGAKFRCLLTDEPIEEEHIKAEGKAGRLGTCLLAVVADGHRGRIYLPATDVHVQAATVQAPEGEVDELLSDDPRNIWCVGYGLKRFSQLFSPRQLTAMVTISDLVRSISARILHDAAATKLSGKDADAYARTVVTFLALALDRCADSNNSLCRWDQSAAGQRVKNLFGRQAIPMLWDFAEANILGERSVSWSNSVDITATSLEAILPFGTAQGTVRQVDAATGANGTPNLLVSTDPPYYDNISYAGLSDFFYVWLRRSIGDLYPDLFTTLLVPKLAELTASPERFEGDKEKAKRHFETGFRKAFAALRERMDRRFPLTVYYAFKQSDEAASDEDAEDNDFRIDLTTGWETLLEALISSGFQITATWPVRASQKWRMVSMGTNALASYIVLACRPRSDEAPQIASTQFRRELKQVLPAALRRLQQGNIAPVDFAQAALGPGMAVYSRYSRILESAGKPMSVRSAINIINQTLTEVLSELEDDFDGDTRWAIAWFEQHGFAAGEFGDAELLSKAKAISVSGLKRAGIVQSKGSKVRLLRPDELLSGWLPPGDRPVTIWEMTHHLLRLYHHEKVGDDATAALLRQFGANGEVARELAYRLFKIAENRKLSSEAQSYNSLVLGWPEIARIARTTPTPPEPIQRRLI
jgi:putative DNA methylase